MALALATLIAGSTHPKQYSQVQASVYIQGLFLDCVSCLNSHTDLDPVTLTACCCC